MRFLLGFFIFSALVTPAFASDLKQQQAARIFFSEARIGVFLHDPLSVERGAIDLNGEILFHKPITLDDAFWNLVIPRPHLGGTLNAMEKTSHVYAGLTWGFDLTPKIFIEGALGAALHDGHTGAKPIAGHNAMGCSLHFRESASLGYRFDQNWSVLASIEHVSNGGMCNHNRGLTNVGLRVGYTF
jgi:lipid A 3-O-deacylase